MMKLYRKIQNSVTFSTCNLDYIDSKTTSLFIEGHKSNIKNPQKQLNSKISISEQLL